MKYAVIILAALVLALGLLQADACSDAPSGVQKWEYTIFDEGIDDVRRAKKRFDALGAEGWELVGGNMTISFFKRPKK